MDRSERIIGRLTDPGKRNNIVITGGYCVMDNAIKTKNLNIRTSEADYKRIQEFAKFQGVSMSGFILDLVNEYIENWEDIRDYKKAMVENEKTYSLAEIAEKNGL